MKNYNLKRYNNFVSLYMMDGLIAGRIAENPYDNTHYAIALPSGDELGIYETEAEAILAILKSHKA